MQNLRRVFEVFDIATSKKFVFDREMALMSALVNCCPFARTLLCIWHKNKNITANMRRHFYPTKESKQSYLTWNGLVQAQSNKEYGRHLVAMRVDLPDH